MSVQAYEQPDQLHIPHTELQPAVREPVVSQIAPSGAIRGIAAGRGFAYGTLTDATPPGTQPNSRIPGGTQ